MKPGGDAIVYPMHMDVNYAIKIVVKKPFSLEEKFDGRILVFKKIHSNGYDT